MGRERGRERGRGREKATMNKSSVIMSQLHACLVHVKPWDRHSHKILLL